jgi:RHS repeat-associated protein
VSRSVSVVTNEGSDQSLTYDGYGRVAKKVLTREGRTILTVEYTYQDTPVAALGITNPTANGTAANTVVYDYVYNGSSLSYLTVTSTNFGAESVTEELYFGNGTVTYGDDVYYYVTNLQGDVVAIIDADGNVKVEYTYDAWGKILSISGPMADTLGAVNPLTYRGYVYDTETDLYYLESRYYDPAVERFINGDGAYDTNQGFLGYNLYIYCLNNSVNMYDPNGRCGRFLGFLWKVDCGQASCPDSKYYVKPKTIDPKIR